MSMHKDFNPSIERAISGVLGNIVGVVGMPHTDCREMELLLLPLDVFKLCEVCGVDILFITLKLSSSRYTLFKLCSIFLTLFGLVFFSKFLFIDINNGRELVSGNRTKTSNDSAASSMALDIRSAKLNICFVALSLSLILIMDTHLCCSHKPLASLY